MALRRWASLARLFGRSVVAEGPRAALRRVQRYRQSVRETSAGAAPTPGTRKAVLFLAGCPGATLRYRCENPRAELERLGVAADVVGRSAVKLARLADGYDTFVLQRVAFDAEVGALVAAARASGRRVIADVDDLLIHERYLGELRHLRGGPALDVEIAADLLRGIGRTIAHADLVTVSTPVLAAEVERTFPGKPVRLVPNRVSADMVRAADAALAARGDEGQVTLGYFSGTPTHARDLSTIVPVLDAVLREHEHVRLLLGGAIEIPGELAAFGGRVLKVPLVPWEQLPALLVRASIHLVPLEDCLYCAAKSEVKFLEAGLVHRPVVASRVGRLGEVIAHGEDGMTCATPGEWRDALSTLIADAELRRRLGDHARASVERAAAE